MSPLPAGGSIGAAAMLAATPPAVPDAEEVMARAGGENFPVALRLLARPHRRQLMAIYGFARLVDELGDSIAGDRLAALDWLQSELDRAYAGRAQHPLMRTLQQALAERRLPKEPLVRLIEANRLDQRVKRYETFEQLLGYCELSANPVGELVLRVFDLATPERLAASADVCTALQLAEHWQDVMEDLAQGRVYLPAEDLRRFDVDPSRLARADDALRARMRDLMAFEVERARALLDRGAPLVASAAGRPRLALAAFVAGGEAALAAIERAGFDVLDGPPEASGQRRLRALAAVLWEQRR
jgi:squalene synthase HpnC